MALYKVSSDHARIRGAIGMFYPISELIEAETENEAETVFRQKYEAHFPKVEIQTQSEDD